MAGERVPGADSPRVTDIEQLAITVWNRMGGEIQWAALPWIAEHYGCDDFDALVDLLVCIRAHGSPRNAQPSE